MRSKYEAEYLAPFIKVAENLGLPYSCGQGRDNRFDPEFGLDPRQGFQFGDLRVEKEDRTVLVEVEGGGGLTNLLKYWPQACLANKPMILLHVFAKSSADDYLAHHRLWKFVWGKMSQDVARTAPGRLFARVFPFRHGNSAELGEAVDAFRRSLTDPLDAVTQEG